MIFWRGSLNMKLTFPHLGNGYISIEALLEGMGHQAITPPFSNKRTLELGSKLSPEQTCLPFKIILGNMLEGIHNGADAVLMIGGWGPCRLGYYGEIQKILLGEHGRQVQFFTLEVPRKNYGETWRSLRSLFGTAKLKSFLHGCQLAWAKLEALENLEKQALVVRPREKKLNLTSSVLKAQLASLQKAQSMKEIQNLYLESREAFAEILDQRQSKRTLKVAIVGEIYTVLEPFSNLNLEVQLGHLGVEVVRTIFLRDWIGDHVFKKLQGRSHLKPLIESAQGYLGGFVGGHGLESIAHSVDLAQEGVDGIIHIYPLTCMPEVVAHGILPKVSADHQIPIMSLVVDEHSSEIGFQTRLEAFVDLLERRKDADAQVSRKSLSRD